LRAEQRRSNVFDRTSRGLDGDDFVVSSSFAIVIELLTKDDIAGICFLFQTSALVRKFM